MQPSSNEPTGKNKRPGGVLFDTLRVVSSNSVEFIVVLILILFVLLIAWALISHNFLQSLQEIEVARGLITFLIAIATVAIALILALYAFTGDSGEFKERFAMGKEVLTILIGVLGTIVGFYFGSAKQAKPQAEAVATEIQIIPPFISNDQPAKGDTTTIFSVISGGKAPYKYSITFDPSIIPPIKDISSSDGIVKQKVPILSTFQEDKEIFVQIDAKDSEGKSVTSRKDASTKFKVKK
jgi:hypothetical protein